MSRFRFLVCILLLAFFWTSCAAPPTPTLVPTPSPSPQPTEAKPATLGDGAPFKTGARYSDTRGDMPISFLDVVAFWATVDEESETFEVVLSLRDIPETVTRGQVTNFVEYIWIIYVYLDPSNAAQTDQPSDYYLALNTNIEDPMADTRHPILGTPVSVPFYQLFENTSIYNSSGISISLPDVDINPDLDRLTFRGRMPGITSRAVFSFDMRYFDGTTDRPDNYLSPESANVSTPLPRADLPVKEDPAQLIPAGSVRAFPGPEHYAGDVLTFEITNDSFGDGTIEVSMSLDNQELRNVSATSSWTGLQVLNTLDTTNLSGHHTLQFKTPDGILNETYSFDVLPASQRPANETRASWATKETDCCIFHYISETAAGRDIAFITDHFQKGADEFSTFTGSPIDQKLDVYFVDRLWGNGGFGGGGELLICYTDRYYGPTIGAEGLEVLARHEFTHATGIGTSATVDGVDFNSEGLAVYVAGGHYKKEPLAERAAALYDLGYYVPVGEFLAQHELSYLYAAAMLTYISETYGPEKIWTFLNADDHPDDGQLGPLDFAIQSTFGVSLKEFDQGLQDWLEGHEPGEQLVDLRLTVELQDLRRQYQETYSPAPQFLLAEMPDVVTRPEYLPMVMREAQAPANVAVELMIANAQQALLDGNYPAVESLDKIIAETLSTGNVEHPIAKDYLNIVLAAESKGYEVLKLTLQRDHASAQVSADPPILADLELQEVDGNWQIQP